MTDQFVQDVAFEECGVSVRPLSVSSDRIAVCAWRCANLLREFGECTGWQLDRVGVRATEDSSDSSPLAASGIVEVYLAGALALWGFPFRGYKRTPSRSAASALEQRLAILEGLEDAGADWLSLAKDVREARLQNDDAFDSFVCALVARAAAIGRTLPPQNVQRATAEREGWIHLPTPASIDCLGS